MKVLGAYCGPRVRFYAEATSLETLPMKVSETCSSQGSGCLRPVSRLGPEIVDVGMGPLCFRTNPKERGG